MSALNSPVRPAAAGLADILPPVTARRRLADLVSLLRPAHWAKTALVVPVALLDTPHPTASQVGRVGWSVLVFILASSAAYVGNDIADRHRDRHHPTKRHRPVAGGRIPVAAAALVRVALWAGLAALLATGPDGLAWPVLAYLGLNLAYNRGLKHIPLIEAGAVAGGFVLRAMQGYAATGEPASGWLLVTVFAGCLLLIAGKRRQELLETGAAHRPALRGYTVELATHLLQLTGGLTLVAGLFYLHTESPFAPYGQPAMLLSVPLALFVLARYLQVVLVQRGGGDPVRVLLRDRPIVIAGALWAAVLGATLALARYPGLAEGILP